jgi:hypothetical protein
MKYNLHPYRGPLDDGPFHGGSDSWGQLGFWLLTILQNGAG